MGTLNSIQFFKKKTMSFAIKRNLSRISIVSKQSRSLTLIANQFSLQNTIRICNRTFSSSTPQFSPKQTLSNEQPLKPISPTTKNPMELISKVPVTKVASKTARCDGGGGALGHPAVFINLEKPGPHPCGYCGLRFERAEHH